jgi:hypothetical protein
MAVTDQPGSDAGTFCSETVADETAVAIALDELA